MTELNVECVQKIIDLMLKLEKKLSQLELLEKKLDRVKYAKESDLKTIALGNSDTLMKKVLKAFEKEDKIKLIKSQKENKVREINLFLTNSFTLMFFLMKRIVEGKSMKSQYFEILIDLFGDLFYLVEASSALSYNLNPIIPLLTELKIMLEFDENDISENDISENDEIKKCVDALYDLIFERE